MSMGNLIALLDTRGRCHSSKQALVAADPARSDVMLLGTNVNVTIESIEFCDIVI